MSARRHRPAARGFTLIELMVVVSIIGMLSSVAFPTYSRMLLRAKAAERSVVMNGIGQAINDLAQNQQRLPLPLWTGAWNPALPATTSKRPMDWTLAGWRDLPMIVEGGSYYSYFFLGIDGGVNAPTTVLLFSQGDLDGDGVASSVQQQFTGVGYSLQLVWQSTPWGSENNATF
jgi:prepilin-type N-terminal cleavage/methylation domain-containing protein